MCPNPLSYPSGHAGEVKREAEVQTDGGREPQPGPSGKGLQSFESLLAAVKNETGIRDGETCWMGVHFFEIFNRL